MAHAEFRPWLHWPASFVLLVLYLPSYCALPWMILALADHVAALDDVWELVSLHDVWLLLSSSLTSCVAVSGSLPLLVFGGRRLEPRTRLALWGFLIVGCLPHTLLIGLWSLSSFGPP
ncbi:MAG TPA: hypothetical protein VHM25_15215 [Polyangiaceae bacterium]|jgi:hypothetical protein|nr:hypothetical protein [Polyangiaceae bacterium]